MRVPTNSNTEQIVDRINSLKLSQSNLQKKVATGQRFSQASEDPSAMGRVLTLQNEQARLSQYQTNTAYAMDISMATYSGYMQMKKVSNRIGELATLSQSTASQDSLTAYAAEVDQMIAQTAQLANTKLRNDYLYAGTELSGTVAHPAPFELNTTTGYYEYWGSPTQVSIAISENSSITPGSDAATNGKLKDFLNNMIDLSKALKLGDQAGITVARTNLEESENDIVSAVSAQGAVQARIEIVNTQRNERYDNIEGLISKERDIDLPEAITHLNQASLAYQAALSSASQIMKTSLLDYI
jgi:flagellar hook-associated protein 3 FlgL